MRQSESINELAAALAKAQSVMAAAAKDSNNPFFKAKYADLASCWDAWRPAGPPQGLALLQFPTATEERLDPPITVQADGDRKAKTIHFIQRVSVETLLVHSSGQFVSETLTVLVKDDSPQSTLLGETYCRRGGMAAVIGIAPDDDDDGNAASNHDADMGSRDTKPPKPACPQCGKNEFVLADREVPNRFFCWKNTEKKKFGCGHKWDAGVEAPPAEQPPEGKAQQLAAEHGMTTGDKVAPKEKLSKAVQSAFEKLTEAVKNHDAIAVAAIINAALERKDKGQLTEEALEQIQREASLSLRKINAAQTEPNSAAA